VWWAFPKDHGTLFLFLFFSFFFLFFFSFFSFFFCLCCCEVQVRIQALVSMGELVPTLDKPCVMDILQTMAAVRPWTTPRPRSCASWGSQTWCKGR